MNSLKKINSILKHKYDLFVCSGSFESRCLSIANALNSDRVGKVIIASNDNMADIVGANTRKLRTLFPQKSVVVKTSSSDPILTFRALEKSLSQFALNPERKRVLVDITAFTREALLILIQMLHFSLGRMTQIEFVYAGASEYSIGKIGRDKWLSKGIKDVRTVLGYPGRVLPSRRNHLVLLVGFESERATEVIERIEPAFLSIGYGKDDSSISKAHQETNRFFFDDLLKRRVRSLFSESLNIFEFSPDNAVSTQEELRRVVDSRNNVNTILVAMNTKLSTLGAGALALRDESIQLCYAEPEQYNVENYSSPSDSFYWVDSNFLDF